MNKTEIGWVGRYGGKLLAMLKEYDPDRYTSMLFEGTLKEYLLIENERISSRIWDLTQELATQNGVTEDLKRRDQMRWVQEVNSLRHMAEEMVLAEYVE